MNNDINPWQPSVNGNGKITPNQVFPQAAPSSFRRGVLDIDLRRTLRVWPWIFVFAFLGLAAGYMMLRYTIPVFKAYSSINIQQKEEISLGQAFFGTRDPFNDKLGWFRSPSVAKEVVEKLKLQYSATLKGVIKDKDLYNSVRWEILSDSANTPVPPLSFKVFPKANSFSYESGNEKGEAKWGIPFSINKVQVVVTKLRTLSDGTEIICSVIDSWKQAFFVSSNLQINSVKESNIIDISYVDISPERAVDILNTVSTVYNQSLVSEKEESFSKAINFIEQRLGPLNRELDSIENSASQFKSQKGFVGANSNGAIYQQQMYAADQQLIALRLQKQTIQAVEDFVNNPNTKDENLSLIGITDSYLQSLIFQFQKLRVDRLSLSRVVTENNEELKTLDKQLTDVKSNIGLQIFNYKRNIQFAENGYLESLNRSKQLVANTPPDEKILLDKARQQNIKEQLFLLLLQKREEAAIAKASVTVNTKILRPAIAQSNPISPDKPKTLASFLLAGALLPLIFAFSKEFLNRRIISKKQLEKNLSVPVLAELEYDKDSAKKSVIMDYKDRTMFSEQIRSLRANLSFYGTKGQPMFVLITSSMSGEGKSFISSNLARSYSMQGKKVALVEMDLRRPKLSKRFNIKNDKGLSMVLSGQLAPQDIVVSLLNDEVLHLFPSGPVPPNPSELITSSHAEVLKNYLSENYDVIIIDTPPYGIVADAQLLAHWAQVTLVITRFNMTILDQTQEIENWYTNKIFPSMAVVFNAIQMKGYYGYKYGYYYYRKQKGYSYYTPGEEAVNN